MNAEDVIEDLIDKTGRRIICVALKGSRNYGLNTIASDYDYNAFFIPSMYDLYKGYVKETTKTFSGVIDGEEYEGTMYDIRRLPELTLGSNPCFLEFYYSKDVAWRDTYDLAIYINNHKRALVNNNPLKLYLGALGVISGEVDHMKTGNAELTEVYGYNPKKAMHAYRVAELMRAYAEYGWYDLGNHLRPEGEEKKIMLDMRAGVYSEDECMRLINAKVEELKAYENNYKNLPISRLYVTELEDEIYQSCFKGGRVKW